MGKSLLLGAIVCVMSGSVLAEQKIDWKCTGGHTTIFVRGNLDSEELTYYEVIDRNDKSTGNLVEQSNKDASKLGYDCYGDVACDEITAIVRLKPRNKLGLVDEENGTGYAWRTIINAKTTGFEFNAVSFVGDTYPSNERASGYCESRTKLSG